MFLPRPRTATHQRPPGGLRSYQAPRTLLERQGGFRQLEFGKGIAPVRAAPIQAGFQHRIVGRRKRELVDRNQRQGIARHIPAFTETRAADQHRILLRPKTFYHLPSRSVTLAYNKKPYTSTSNVLLKRTRNA